MSQLSGEAQLSPDQSAGGEILDRIGFVVLTHSHPEQVNRLLVRLSELYSQAPIALHHDFSQCSLNLDAFANVRIVRPHIPTRWGDVSLTEATLAALRLLYSDGSGPDWFTLLSGADYPVKRPELVLRDLETGGHSVYIHHELIDPGKPIRDWHEMCLQRYVDSDFWVPGLPRKGELPARMVRLRRLAVALRLTPFSGNFKCYAGSQWFTATRDAALYILRWADQNPDLLKYLKGRSCPEETYFHSILANSGRFRLTQGTGDVGIARSFRYILWSGTSAHPKEIGTEDLPAIKGSGAHFARKFSPAAPVLDRIDEMLGLGKQ